MGGAGKNVWPALNGVFEGFHRSPRGSCHSASVAVGEAQSNQSQPKSNRSELADAQNPGHCNVAASDWGKNPPKTASKGSEKESQTRQAQPNIPGKTRLCAAAAKGLNSRECVAGAGGFEPPHGGIKIRCLTAWRRPNNSTSADVGGGTYWRRGRRASSWLKKLSPVPAG